MKRWVEVARLLKGRRVIERASYSSVVMTRRELVGALALRATTLEVEGELVAYNTSPRKRRCL